MAPSLPEFRKYLDKTLKQDELNFGLSCVDPGVGFNNAYDPFQLEVFCNSMS